MATEVKLPRLGQGMESGTIVRWLKTEGDAVSKGEPLYELDTDKVTQEVEAESDGVLLKIVIADGEVDVGTTVGIIGAQDEDVSEVLAGAQGGNGGAPAAAEQEAAPPTEPGVQAAAQEPAAEPEPASAAEAQPPVRAEGEHVKASPLARRIARERGVDLAQVVGTGPEGRVIAEDVEKAAIRPAAGPAAQPEFEVVELTSTRKTIARRLTEARQTVPQFYLTMDCEIDALLKLREQVNAAAPKDKDGKPAWKVSVNDMAIKALAMALMRVPDANVTWTEGAMLRHKHADVGVAVALPGNGLITPIIRAAETKTLSVIANQMKDFAARAKNRKLKPEEYQGGTTAVSNLGMFGIKEFTAVINPPHSTILAVGGGSQRAVVRKGELAVATVMSVTLSCDHRAVDGALGAQLIAAFKELVENPMGMLV